jgi:hypothetical protein
LNKKDELYWGDRERIKRAEEMRRKNEKKGGEKCQVEIEQDLIDMDR